MPTPGQIKEAEIYGMPEPEPEKYECQCGREVEIIYQCAFCGMRCCEKCRTYIEKYLESFHVPECAIHYLLKEMGRLEDEANKYWKIKEIHEQLTEVVNECHTLCQSILTTKNNEQRVAEAAKKAATTGTKEDLATYLRLRRELLL